MNAQHFSADSELPAGYFVAIGSNLDPHTQVPVIVNLLVRRFHRLWLSSVVKTAPCGMVSENDFLNAVCFLPTELPQTALKQFLIEIEEQLGRDRSHPDKKIQDRAADLDILLQLPAGARLQGPLPRESYIGPMLRELALKLQLLAADEGDDPRNPAPSLHSPDHTHPVEPGGNDRLPPARLALGNGTIGNRAVAIYHPGEDQPLEILAL